MIYLRTNPPARAQYRSPRRARPTGCVVVHTAESALDLIGPDSGAENVAAFIRRRTDPGSYHDLVDSDSAIQLVRYEDEAFQDGTGSNPWALSLSFALRGTDWPRLTTARRDAYLEQGAVAVARQQQWLRAHGYPTSPLRRIDRPQSERGVAGYIGHGERDPGRRTDPGTAFPWVRFFQVCTVAVTAPHPAPATAVATPSEEDDMQYQAIRRQDGAIALTSPGYFRHVSVEEWAVAQRTGQAKPPVGEPINEREWDVARAVALGSDR